MIDEEIYQQVAYALRKEIEGKDYFNGTIEYDTGEFHSVLRATLLVYRRPAGDRASTVSDIVPVWWDFEMVQSCGRVPTDFCWNELRPLLTD